MDSNSNMIPLLIVAAILVALIFYWLGSSNTNATIVANPTPYMAPTMVPEHMVGYMDDDVVSSGSMSDSGDHQETIEGLTTVVAQPLSSDLLLADDYDSSTYPWYYWYPWGTGSTYGGYGYGYWPYYRYGRYGRYGYPWGGRYYGYGRGYGRGWGSYGRGWGGRGYGGRGWGGRGYGGRVGGGRVGGHGGRR